MSVQPAGVVTVATSSLVKITRRRSPALTSGGIAIEWLLAWSENDEAISDRTAGNEGGGGGGGCSPCARIAIVTPTHACDAPFVNGPGSSDATAFSRRAEAM